MDEKLVKEIGMKLGEKNTEELSKILKDYNEEEWSQEAFESIRRILVSRGKSLPEQPFRKSVRAENGLSEGSELRGVVLNGGISRKAINIIAFAGLFIFGWLITIAFDLLGKGKTGGWYFKALLVTLLIARFFAPPLGILALIIYITACIHANLLLSHYKKLARERIAEIDSRGEVNIDTEIEKGLLFYRVIGDRKTGVGFCRKALEMPGGDPFLLNLAGVVLSHYKQYKEAGELFDRVLASTKDKALIKQTGENINYVNKKIAKQKHVS